MSQKLFTELELYNRAKTFLEDRDAVSQEMAEAGDAMTSIKLREAVDLGTLLGDFQALGCSQSIRGALDNMQRMAHNLSRSKGWYEGRERQYLEFHMLMVTEIAEATEAVRNNEPPVWIDDNGVVATPENDENFWNLTKKPEGEMIELADCVIRIMDYFEHRGHSLADCIILKHEYNATRPHRHGGKAL